MNEGDRAAAAAASQAARASLSLRMQAEPTATVSNMPAIVQPGGVMNVSFSTSPTGFTTGSTESEEEVEWQKVQSSSEKRATREKRKADQAEINTPSSPLGQSQGATSSRMSPAIGRSPTEQYQPKSYSPTAILTATKDGKAIDLKNVSPVAIAKYLEPLVSKEAIKKVSPHPKNGSLTITTSTEGHLTEVLQITKLGPWDVNATPFSRSTCIGVIENVHPLVTTKEIGSEICSQVLIKSAERIMKKGGVATTCVKIHFEGPTLPQTVRLGYSVHSVRKYIPEAIQCFKCRYFGHKAIECRAKQRCARCGESHATKTCNVERQNYRCANCGGPHSSAYGGCIERKKAQKIVQVSVIHEIPRKEAAKAIESGVSFASVVSGSSTANKVQPTKPSPSLKENPPPVTQPSTSREADLEAKFNLILGLLVEVIGSLAAHSDPAISILVSTAKSLLESSAPTITSETLAPSTNNNSPKKNKRKKKKARRTETRSNQNNVESEGDGHTSDANPTSIQESGNATGADSGDDLYGGIPPPVNK